MIPKTAQWKQASTELAALFDEWQSQQQNGPRLPKSTGQQLWKRFRDARATVDKHRREFYAELDEAHKARARPQGRSRREGRGARPEGRGRHRAYRELLDQWKTAGRAGKKVDDALWARFKAAGDALYGARVEREAAEPRSPARRSTRSARCSSRPRPSPTSPTSSRRAALLTRIQRRWDEIGRIFPRDKERVLDDDLRKIERRCARARRPTGSATTPRRRRARTT